MCGAGQKRAALWAMELLLAGGDLEKENILNRANRALRGIYAGADVKKHNLIALVVVDAYTDGRLVDYIDPDTGIFRLRTADGREFDANIFDKLLSGKDF